MIGSKFGFAGQNQSYSSNSSVDALNRKIENYINIYSFFIEIFQLIDYNY
jgi:hypothetical protein